MEGRGKGENGNLHKWESECTGDRSCMDVHHCSPGSLQSDRAARPGMLTLTLSSASEVNPLAHPGITDTQAD